MDTKSARERRRGQRVQLSFHVEVSGVGLNGIPYCDHAAASDVSDRGCQVHLAREVKTGDLLTLRVVRRERPTPDRQGPFLYQAVWVEPTENGGGWIAGLAALDPGNPWLMNFPEESLMQTQ
jgi:PilZ domain